MNKGDVVLIPFPFTDLSGNKTRPAIVLADRESDIIVAFISTRFHYKEETDILILPTSENGLKKDSLLRVSKIATLEKTLALGRLGTFNAATIMQVNDALKKILQIN